MIEIRAAGHVHVDAGRQCPVGGVPLVPGEAVPGHGKGLSAMTQKIPIQPAHDREEQGRMAGPEWAGIPKQTATTKPQGLEFSAVAGDHGFRAVLVQHVL